MDARPEYRSSARRASCTISCACSALLTNKVAARRANILKLWRRRHTRGIFALPFAQALAANRVSCSSTQAYLQSGRPAAAYFLGPTQGEGVMLKNTLAGSKTFCRAIVFAGIFALAAAAPRAAQAGTAVFTPNGAGAFGSLQSY